MRGLKKSNVVQFVLVMALGLVLGACDADSPTAPTQTPNPPASASATTGFAISVGLNPGSITAGEATTVTVSVSARRTDTNQPVPRGSTAVLTTTNGLLTNAEGTDSGNTVAITFDVNGQAQASLAAVTEDATVRAQIEQSSGQATLSVSEAPTVTPFTLTGVVPSFGPPAGGTEVRIEGTGFSAPVQVVFGNVIVPAFSVTSSTIKVLSPAIELPSGTNQTVSISVSVNVGEEGFASGSLSNSFTYTRNQTPVIPKIISVTPTSGPNEGGTRVTIFGEAFGAEVQVFFGDDSLIEAPIVDVSSTRILVDTPPATGTNSSVQNKVVSVRVRDLRSGFEASLSNAFLYGDDDGDFQITAISPGEGLYLGGTLVTIFSTGGFEAPVAVEFGLEAQQVVSVSGTEIVARAVPIEVGCGGQSGPTSVVNIETGESFTDGPTFTYRTVQPEIGTLTPDTVVADVVTGALLGSDAARMTGGGFDRQSNLPIVTIAGEPVLAPLAIVSIDPSPAYDGYGIGDEMTFRIPPAPTPWPTEDCTDDAGADGDAYVDQDVSAVVTVRDTGCTASIPFTYVPSDGGCRVPPPDPVTPVAEFSFSFSGTEITVTDLSSNDPDEIKWDFGDGIVSNWGMSAPGQPETHDYGDTGHSSGDPFSVTLTARNAAGTSVPLTKTGNIP